MHLDIPESYLSSEIQKNCRLVLLFPFKIMDYNEVTEWGIPGTKLCMSFLPTEIKELVQYYTCSSVPPMKSDIT
jgi:hypothetical protein